MYDKKVIKVTRKGFAPTYAIETGAQLSEHEFICLLAAPHGFAYRINEVDMDNGAEWIERGYDLYYYPWLCSKVANYDFTPEEFSSLFHSGTQVF